MTCVKHLREATTKHLAKSWPHTSHRSPCLQILLGRTPTSDRCKLVVLTLVTTLSQTCDFCRSPRGKHIYSRMELSKSTVDLADLGTRFKPSAYVSQPSATVPALGLLSIRCHHQGMISCSLYLLKLSLLVVWHNSKSCNACQIWQANLIMTTFQNNTEAKRSAYAVCWRAQLFFCSSCPNRQVVPLPSEVGLEF